MAYEKRDIGLTITNGSTGKTFLNSVREFMTFYDDTDKTVDELKIRIGQYATKLAALVELPGDDGPRVTKINYPAFQNTAKTGAPVSCQKMVYIAEVRESDNHENTIEISGAVVGVPSTISPADAEVALTDLLDDQFGVCSGNQLVRRFVRLKYSGLKTIKG